MIDLHVHTSASDGSDTPRQVVLLAAERHLDAIAITDHDTVAGISEAVTAGKFSKVRVIPGIEFSADYLGYRVHILGLFIDPAAPSIQEACIWSVRQRDARNERIISSMRDDGLPISMGELLQEYPGVVLGRPHIAEHLVKKGVISSIQEGFERYLRKGARYGFSRERMSLAQAVQVIRAAEGLAILAHPLQYGFDNAAREAFICAGRDAGAAGLEAYYSEHSLAEQAMLLQTATRYGMAVSGGSDYHGSRKPHIALGTGIDGSLHVPNSVLEALDVLRQARRGNIAQ